MEYVYRPLDVTPQTAPESLPATERAPVPAQTNSPATGVELVTPVVVVPEGLAGNGASTAPPPAVWQPPARTRDERPSGSGLKRLLGRIWPALLVALSQAKYLVYLLKFKALGTFVTMLLSLLVYASVFGLPFALGFIALLFVHEMGHALILKRQGVKATAPLFIPFMGALIGMRELPKNAYAEAQMALGGPILGSLGALVCLILWQVTGSPLFLALTYIGCWLNLFNLIPLSPLDGGRAMAAISPFGWLIGLGLMFALFLRVHSLFLGFILLLGAMEVIQRWRTRRFNADYYTVSLRHRLLVATTYFGLAGILALSMAALQSHLLYHQPGL